jgi:hypothetical protein
LIISRPAGLETRGIKTMQTNFVSSISKFTQFKPLTLMYKWDTHYMMGLQEIQSGKDRDVLVRIILGVN